MAQPAYQPLPTETKGSLQRGARGNDWQLLTQNHVATMLQQRNITLPQWGIPAKPQCIATIPISMLVLLQC